MVVPCFLRDGLADQLAGKDATHLMFASRAGTPLRVQNLRRDWFDRAAAATGVPGLTPPELRHTAVSLAIASGAADWRLTGNLLTGNLWCPRQDSNLRHTV